MSDPIHIESDGNVSLMMSNPNGSLVVTPAAKPPGRAGGDGVPARKGDRLVLRDESGQPWAIRVCLDGQLQTAKWPETTESR